MGKPASTVMARPLPGGGPFRPALVGLCFGFWIFFQSALLLGAEAKGEGWEPDHSAGRLVPLPGSYELQYIIRAGDGTVLDTDGAAHRLSEFTGAKVTLLSFIYSSCADPQGCPYVYALFHGLRERLAREPNARGRVRLVSLSFDPARDTPEMLRLYAGDHANPAHPVEWRFLTTAGLRDLVPILDDFGQDVFLEVDPVTKLHLGTYSHVVKVFLIDARHWVREIYTSAYLDPEMVYNDVITLLMEEGSKPRAESSESAAEE